MWSSRHAKELSRLYDLFMTEETAVGNKRTRFVSTFFMEWVPDKTSKRFLQDFTKQVEIWSTAPMKRMQEFIHNLLTCDLCKLCSKNGRTSRRKLLCGHCTNTAEGQAFAQQSAVASVRRRWTEDYDELMEKQRSTSREKYGTEYPWQSKKHNKTFLEKKRNTCTERYGFPYAVMNNAVYLRVAKSGFRIKTLTVEGVEFNCQGYEHHILPKLVKRFGVRNVVSQFDPTFTPIHDDNSYFAPDFYIKSHKTYVEVKSTYTLIAGLKKNRIKARLSIALDHQVAWYVVYGRHGQVKLPDDWHLWRKTKITSYLKKQDPRRR